MKTNSIFPSFVMVLLLAIVLVASFLLTPVQVSAESDPRAALTLPKLQQEGWDAFWAAFKKWFEDLAEVFAQMPLLGPLVAGLLRFVGAANVWFCGAIIFATMLLGIYAVRR